MPVIELYATAPVKQALDCVADACPSAGFEIDSEGKRRLNVRKGSLALSILVGVFVVYANADVFAEEIEDDETQITFEFGTTWWQGVFGPGRTKSAMMKLVDIVEEELEDAGFKVTDRRN